MMRFWEVGEGTVPKLEDICEALHNCFVYIFLLFKVERVSFEEVRQEA